MERTTQQTPEEREQLLLDFIKIQTLRVQGEAAHLANFVRKALENPDIEIKKQHFAAIEGSIDYTYVLLD